MKSAANEQHAFRLQPVAARPARLLLIMLDRFRHRGVQDEANVGAVDPHAEGDRGDDHIAVFVAEQVLNARWRSSVVLPAW